MTLTCKMYQALDNNHDLHTRLHASKLEEEIAEKLRIEHAKTKATTDAYMTKYKAKIDQLVASSDGKYHRLFCGKYNNSVIKYIRATYADVAKNAKNRRIVFTQLYVFW